MKYSKRGRRPGEILCMPCKQIIDRTKLRFCCCRAVIVYQKLDAMHKWEKKQGCYVDSLIEFKACCVKTCYHQHHLDWKMRVPKIKLLVFIMKSAVLSVWRIVVGWAHVVESIRQLNTHVYAWEIFPLNEGETFHAYFFLEKRKSSIVCWWKLRLALPAASSCSAALTH